MLAIIIWSVSKSLEPLKQQKIIILIGSNSNNILILSSVFDVVSGGKEARIWSELQKEGSNTETVFQDFLNSLTTEMFHSSLLLRLLPLQIHFLGHKTWQPYRPPHLRIWRWVVTCAWNLGLRGESEQLSGALIREGIRHGEMERGRVKQRGFRLYQSSRMMKTQTNSLSGEVEAPSCFI